MTPQEMAQCAEEGRFWYMRGSAQFYGTPTDEPAEPGDRRLGDFPKEWVEQWESWEQAAQEMAPLFERLEQFRE